MDVLIVRHAIAEERDPSKWPDDRGRPLTPSGARRFRRLARSLRGVLPKVDAVWSSPLKRTWQTAEILAEEAGWPAPQELPALEPGGKHAATVSFLRKQTEQARVVLVGHEPGLHELLSHLLSGSIDGVRIEMKKGGAALVRFDDEVAAGKALLLWVLPPRVALDLG